MRNATHRIGWAIAAAISSALLFSAHAAGAEGSDPGELALAERLADTARATLAPRTITDAHMKMAGALLEGATKLNPAEPRYSRLWAEAMLKVGNAEGAVRALNAYVLNEPEDKPALIQLTNLHANLFQTVDKRLEYLRDWVDDARLPDEVRSNLAIQAYAAYYERTQFAQAKGMLDQALKLNPLNMEGLRARFLQAAAEGTPYERVTVLLEIMKSNPAQLQYVERLAQEMSAVGLGQQAVQFYALGTNLARAEGAGVPRSYAIEYAEELILINQLVMAKQLIDQMVAADPGDFESVALRLLVERAMEQKEPSPALSILRLQKILLNRLQMFRQKLGDKTATTRPVEEAGEVAWGSFDADVKALKELGGEDAAEQRSGYVATLAQIAWLELYFRQSSADAKPVIEAIRQLVPPDDAALARLEGWDFLVRGQNDQAKVKLSAIKEKDEIAALGFVRTLDAAASAKEGEKLLAAHPTGLNGVLILDGLRDRKVMLVPNAELVAPINEALAKFPAAWLGILSQPASFYTLKVDPVRVSHAFGEPMLVKVTIQNTSAYPITIGPEGVLHPDLLFGAEFRGVVQQSITGALYEHIEHEVVLKPHATLTQMVRIDEGSIAQVLSGSPFPAMQIMLRVRTNPSPVGMGPAGQIVQASRSIERRSFTLTQDSLQKLGRSLQQGGPAEKMANIDLAAKVAVLLSQQKGEDMQRVSLQLVEALRGLTRDPSPPVATWAGSTLASISPPSARPTAVTALINDPYWPARLLGLCQMGPMKLAEQSANATQVASHDTDAIVVSFANALDEWLTFAKKQAAEAPATQATTNPSNVTAPANPDPFGPRPTAPPTTKPTGPDVIIPPLPLTLPPLDKPAGKP